ncbi:glycosyltransferase family 2 protein [Planktotalea sp.]|uniref:glycosyltransferase family 2 protein n=1 Tax=Planktotalea sp. TaxID=2029877 RepID=UPI003D6BC73F
MAEFSGRNLKRECAVPRYSSLKHFLSTGKDALAKGPIAMIFVEDDVEVGTTLRHHFDCGFKQIIVFMPDAFELPDDIVKKTHRVTYDMARDRALETAVNAIIEAAPDTWFYYCYNAEYLFYPFCETRSVGEMIAYNMEERRDTILTYVVDLYADNLRKFPNAVSLEHAHMDRSGYYALARNKPGTEWPEERQLDFFGGLRWRYEEHISEASRKIDRVGLFKSCKGLELRANHTFNLAEYNTYACEWHHNLSAAIMSFRTAKALKRNPGSSFDIETFQWHNSSAFEWHSRQLLDLGLMEPGQWF